MAMAYAIKDWSKNFENAQSRKVEDPHWVRVPIHHGLRYKRLMKAKGGVEAFGVFIALVEIAATCEPRGKLVDESGPLTVEDLAGQTDIPEPVLKRALEVLIDAKIGWIVEADSETSQVEPESIPKPRSLDSESNKVSLEGEERRLEEKERRGRVDPPPSTGSRSSDVGAGVEAKTEARTEAAFAVFDRWSARDRTGSAMSPGERMTVCRFLDDLDAQPPIARPGGPVAAVDLLPTVLDGVIAEGRALFKSAKFAIGVARTRLDEYRHGMNGNGKPGKATPDYAKIVAAAAGKATL